MSSGSGTSVILQYAVIVGVIAVGMLWIWKRKPVRSRRAADPTS
jgi:hypothetical protein